MSENIDEFIGFETEAEATYLPKQAQGFSEELTSVFLLIRHYLNQLLRENL